MIYVSHFFDRFFSSLAQNYLAISKIVVVAMIATVATFLYGTPLRGRIDRYEATTLGWRSELLERVKARPMIPRPVTDEPTQTTPDPNAEFVPLIYKASDRLNTIILWAVSSIIFLSVLTTGTFYALIRLTLLSIMYLLVSLFAYVFWGLAINLVYPLALIAVSFPILTIYHQFIVLIDRHRLMHLVTKDLLTQLYNFAHFKLLLEGEVRSLEIGHSKQVSLLMIDIDNFKRINDAYGHVAGDEVIRGIADVIRSNCRSLDVASRYGGEEYLLMIPGTTPEDAGRVAEKIRKAIQGRKFYLGDQKEPIEMTASIGVATHFPREAADRLIERADRALYKAKECGRNMVCRA